MLHTPLVRVSLLLGAIAMGMLCLPTEAAPMKWTLGGYLQARLTDTLGQPNSPSTFQDKRASLLVRATDEEHIFLQLFVSGEDTFQIQHAFVEYYDKAFHGRLGLAPIPFGYENPVTSAKLITTERSQVSNRLIGPFALDRGAYAIYLPAKGFNISTAVVNGQPVGVKADTNDTKNIVARLGYMLKSGEVGVSMYNGKNTLGAGALKMDRIGFDILTKQGPFTFISEVMTGKDGLAAGGDVDSIGGYVTAAYRRQGSRSEPYIRLDVFDPNKDAGGDYFSRGTFGYSHYLNPTSKIQAEYETIEDNLSPLTDGRVTFQYQIIF